MAKLFPDLENIDRLTVPPTDGERHLLMLLSSTLDETCEVYFNPYLDGDRPDVIVIKPGCGALVIEVKDWNLAHYEVDINNRWRYETSVIRSPQQQAFRYKKISSTYTFLFSGYNISRILISTTSSRSASTFTARVVSS